MRHARLKPDLSHLYPALDPQTWYGVLSSSDGGIWLSVRPLAWVLEEHCEIREEAPLPSSLNRPY